MTKPVVLLGPVCDDPSESVSAVNRSIADGLREDYEVVCSGANRRCGRTRQAGFNLVNLFYLVKHAIQWTSLLMRHRPEIAHYAISSGWAMEKCLLLLWVARVFRARTVGHLHSGGFIEHWMGLSKLRRSIAARQLTSLDGFVVLSETWRKHMENVVGIPREKLYVVNNPVDAEFETIALSMPVLRDGCSLLSLGTMGRDKGVLELVDACAAVAAVDPGFALDLAGPEREPGIRDIVRKRVAAHGLVGAVRFHGLVHGAEKAELFRRASILVLPSYYENFPLVVIEAAAAGLAIVTTRVGAVPEFFQDGVSAIFVDMGDARKLADAIIRLRRRPDERHRLASEAREVFRRRLNRADIFNSMRTVYGSVLETNPAADVGVDCQGKRESYSSSRKRPAAPVLR